MSAISGTLTDAGDCRMASMSRGPNPLEQVSLGELRRRTSLKWRTYPEDVLPMWVAEMDVMLAEPIARSLIDAIELGDTGYAAGTAYAEALQGFALDRWGWDGIVVERTAIVPDVMMGVVEVLRLVTEPGDAVVVNCPVYPPFYSFVEHMDRRIVEAPLTPEHRLDLDALGEAFARATAARNPAAYLLCNPHNPTGTVHSIDELGAVAALAATHHVRVVADEIHAPVIMPGQRFVPYLSVPGSENAFSLMSASKAWNLAGLKAALAIAGPHATDDLARLPEEVSHGPSHLGLYRPHRRARRRRRLAGRATGRPGPQPPSAHCPDRGAPAAGPLHAAASDLPGLARLSCIGTGRRRIRGSETWSGDTERRTRRGLSRQGTSRLERGTGVRNRRSRARPAQPRHLYTDSHRGSAPHGSGDHVAPS